MCVLWYDNDNFHKEHESQTRGPRATSAPLQECEELQKFPCMCMIPHACAVASDRLFFFYIDSFRTLPPSAVETSTHPSVGCIVRQLDRQHHPFIWFQWSGPHLIKLGKIWPEPEMSWHPWYRATASTRQFVFASTINIYKNVCFWCSNKRMTLSSAGEREVAAF